MPTVLVAHDADPALTDAISALTGRDYLVVNADNKAIYPFLSYNGNNARVITYGFNTKSCITASSVTENAMQICIQREFTGADGNKREPQEFSAPVPSGADVSDVLAASAVYAVVLNPDGLEYR
jgi:UDP-N-acetylmuramyl pentapeptide synthase